MPNIEVGTKRADFAKHERCELLILPASPAAKLVMHRVVTGETLTCTYVLQRKNAKTQRCCRLEKWLHQYASSMLNVPASFPVVRLPEL